MKYLLDTHSLIWALSGRDNIKKIRDIIEDKSNEIYVSVASLWEIQIKNSSRPDTMPFTTNSIFELISNFTDYNLLPITHEYVFALKDIVKQNIHCDPFDHMILSTALVDNLILLTHDDKMSKYSGVRTLLF